MSLYLGWEGLERAFKISGRFPSNERKDPSNTNMAKLLQKLARELEGFMYFK
jgi:hypothetical protein